MRSVGTPISLAYSMSNAASASAYRIHPFGYCRAKLAHSSMAIRVLPELLSPTMLMVRPSTGPPPSASSIVVQPVLTNRSPVLASPDAK